MQVAKWGNSLAISLPASLVEILALREGDDIEIVVDDPRTFAVCEKPRSEVLLERLRIFRGKLPAAKFCGFIDSSVVLYLLSQIWLRPMVLRRHYTKFIIQKISTKRHYRHRMSDSFLE
ncbi:AbrB/MazE/SpoVT family DNA-binding domain-containing protein [Photorhabdus sp. APURE]|uniref:AbrB/MazE/SpoVT family DNA-binding domain-containing protein n=1 Tax=Photorhabdus aballayi TaxID=2991723 RepID=UPI00223E446D|nr:AbrB/MazE/SpoVT family DNA-binding domain-containing protein [Photorhabdus aballayi]MCW7546957.1 AbrB/MazE/SpoVT family DNA-binding domain-containing protein [Photorhabdus aballayi]